MAQYQPESFPMEFQDPQEPIYNRSSEHNSYQEPIYNRSSEHNSYQEPIYNRSSEHNSNVEAPFLLRPAPRSGRRRAWDINSRNSNIEEDPVQGLASPLQDPAVLVPLMAAGIGLYKLLSTPKQASKTEDRAPRAAQIDPPIAPTEDTHFQKSSSPGMTSSKQRLSKEGPSTVPEMMTNLAEHTASFSREFTSREQKMRQNVGELSEIADGVRDREERSGALRRAGAVARGVGIGLLVLSVPLSGGASLAVAAAGAASAVGGTAVVVGVDTTTKDKENRIAKKVEKLGKELLEMVEPLKNLLEEIMTTFETLQQIPDAELEVGGMKVQSHLRKGFVGVKKVAAVLSFTHKLLVAVRAMVTLAVAVYTKNVSLAGLGLSIITVVDLSLTALTGFKEMNEQMEKLKDYRKDVTPVEFLRAVSDVFGLGLKVFGEIGNMK